MSATIGWKSRNWKIKIRCVCCNRKISHGIVHVHDKTDPPVRAMCVGCHRTIMETPQAPAGTPGFVHPDPESD